MQIARDEHALSQLMQQLAATPLPADGEGLLPRERGYKPAAVLVLWQQLADGWHVVLTRRTPHLRSHGGQISFPGGRLEDGDASAAQAALREAEEEIGVPPTAVAVLAEMAEYQTVTGYAVTPVLGLLREAVTFRPSPDEVDEVFSVPLTLVLDVRHYERHAYERDGMRGHYYSLRHGDYFIWGATAAMLRRLALAYHQHYPH